MNLLRDVIHVYVCRLKLSRNHLVQQNTREDIFSFNGRSLSNLSANVKSGQKSCVTTFYDAMCSAERENHCLHILQKCCG